jgi:hypothetical protein
MGKDPNLYLIERNLSLPWMRLNLNSSKTVFFLHDARHLFNTSTWICRRVAWTLDCIHIARKGEDSIIDSIPLAEADLILVSEDGNLETQYKRNPDLAASMRGNILEKQGSMNSIRNKVNKVLERQNSQSQSTAEVTADSPVNTLTAGFKKMQSAKFFNPQTKSLMGKSDLLQEEKSTVLQISTIAEGFNSGACSFCNTPCFMITK